MAKMDHGVCVRFSLRKGDPCELGPVGLQLFGTVVETKVEAVSIQIANWPRWLTRKLTDVERHMILKGDMCRQDNTVVTVTRDETLDGVVQVCSNGAEPELTHVSLLQFGVKTIGITGGLSPSSVSKVAVFYAEQRGLTKQQGPVELWAPVRIVGGAISYTPGSAIIRVVECARHNIHIADQTTEEAIVVLSKDDEGVFTVAPGLTNQSRTLRRALSCLDAIPWDQKRRCLACDQEAPLNSKACASCGLPRYAFATR